MIAYSASNKMMDLMLGDGRDTSFPATVYLALLTVFNNSNPALNVEITEASYARLAFTNNSINFPNAVDGYKTCPLSATWAAATPTWTQPVLGVALLRSAGGLVTSHSDLIATTGTGGSIMVPSGNSPFIAEIYVGVF